MARALTIIGVVAAASLFGWGVPLSRLFGAFQAVIVALSIMIAAILVRLNRGMPTLEWKSLDPSKRADLTASIVSLTREYGWIIAIMALLLAGLICLQVIGKDEIEALWPTLVQRIGSGAVGAGIVLAISRMAYVIWRDLDIIRLQKKLIDGLAAKDVAELETKSATNKIADIRSANLRPIASAEPKNWGD